MEKLRVIDLFSGCGGLSQGFLDAGFNVVLGIDSWNDAVQTFNKNHNTSTGIVANLKNETAKDISAKNNIQNIDVIIGGPPCQGFSIAGKRIVEDERNQLYKSFIEFVRFYKPSAFLIENVPNILSMGNGMVKEKIMHNFKKIGYTVNTDVLMASKYGVPQNRRRAFFVGFRNGRLFDFPKPDTDILLTSEDAISDLINESIDDGDFHLLSPKSEYQRMMRNGSKKIFNHEITNHKEKTIEIINMVPDGGNYKDLPIELRATRKVNIAWTRLNSKKPSFTIDTGHRHHFHYEFNRVPTVRESARIQSFKDDFIFLGSKTSQYKQVGNAVPPILAKKLALAILKQFKNNV
ncbi:MAG: DNA cytosine methyltransferase [Methylococcales symbiont of Hymedesmia sp. n. MRB-2018]|nr:MAG: DNA cytosine methyltransferase [Methylococcales symbiont of Hymedesmia sp. n. MRB-2018]